MKLTRTIHRRKNGTLQQGQQSIESHWIDVVPRKVFLIQFMIMIRMKSIPMSDNLDKYGERRTAISQEISISDDVETLRINLRSTNLTKNGTISADRAVENDRQQQSAAFRSDSLKGTLIHSFEEQPLAPESPGVSTENTASHALRGRPRPT
jgi:hypothetical protein